MNRVLAFLPLIIFAASALAFAWAIVAAEPTGAVKNLTGAPFPAVELGPITGAETGFSTADFGGAPALVNVFASWCAPCRVEHPLLSQISESGVPVFGIAWKDGRDEARGFLDELGNPFTAVGWDGEGRVGEKLAVSGAPETYVVGADGTVLVHWKGPLTPEVVARRILPAYRRALGDS